MSKLYIDHQTDNRIILAVDHGGKHWEIDVTIDPDEDERNPRRDWTGFYPLHVM